MKTLIDVYLDRGRQRRRVPNLRFRCASCLWRVGYSCVDIDSRLGQTALVFNGRRKLGLQAFPNRATRRPSLKLRHGVYLCVSCLWRCGLETEYINTIIGVENATIKARSALGTILVPKRQLGGSHGDPRRRDAATSAESVRPKKRKSVYTEKHFLPRGLTEDAFFLEIDRAFNSMLRKPICEKSDEDKRIAKILKAFGFKTY